MSNQNDSQDWQTLTQAAKSFGRTRQAIESLVKRGVIEAKPMGNKNVLHIHTPTLQMHYASKTVSSPQATGNNQSHNQDLSFFADKIELATTKMDNKRLGDLVGRLEVDLQQTRQDLIEERKRNQELQSELLKLTREMQGILQNEPGLFNWRKILKDRL